MWSEQDADDGDVLGAVLKKKLLGRYFLSTV